MQNFLANTRYQVSIYAPRWRVCYVLLYSISRIRLSFISRRFCVISVISSSNLSNEKCKISAYKIVYVNSNVIGQSTVHRFLNEDWLRFSWLRIKNTRVWRRNSFWCTRFWDSRLVKYLWRGISYILLADGCDANYPPDNTLNELENQFGL